MSMTLINLPAVTDERGQLSILEDQLLEIKRVFWITAAAGQMRGGHCHKTSRQATVALGGQVDIFMDNGVTQQTIILDNPSQCLIIEPEYWHTMTFHEGSNLLVFASNKYDPDDYIFERPSS